MTNVTAEGSPYRQAWRWIQDNPGTGSARNLAKLLLSLWNDDNAFSFRECIDSLDDERRQLALQMTAHFARHGEDRELVDLGYQVVETYPRLWEAGQAACKAKRALYAQWRIDDARADAQESGE